MSKLMDALRVKNNVEKTTTLPDPKDLFVEPTVEPTVEPRKIVAKLESLLSKIKTPSVVKSKPRVEQVEDVKQIITVKPKLQNVFTKDMLSNMRANYKEFGDCKTSEVLKNSKM